MRLPFPLALAAARYPVSWFARKRGSVNGPTRAKALVCEWEDGTTQVLYRGERIAHKERAELPRRVAKNGTKASVDPAFGKAHKPMTIIPGSELSSR